MTTTPERTATLTSLVAAEIRAWMGRLDVRQSELARRMGETDQWMSMRLKGRTPLDLNELQRIAEALGVPVLDLLPRSVRAAGGVNLSLTPVVRSARATSAGTPLRRTASRPMVPTRRDSVRPVSGIPAEHRRPQPTRSPERRRAA